MQIKYWNDFVVADSFHLHVVDLQVVADLAAVLVVAAAAAEVAVVVHEFSVIKYASFSIKINSNDI